jgi:VCBS repeat-containing protein
VATSDYGCSLTIDAFNALQVDEGGTIIVTNGNLRTLDSDDHATALRYEVATAPAHGSLNLSSFTQADIDVGRLTYRHDGSETTADVFEVHVSDAAGRAVSATLALAIGPVNDAPIIGPMAIFSWPRALLWRCRWSIAMPRRDVVDLRMEGLPEGAVLQDSLISWEPTYDQAGRYVVVLKAQDGRGGQVERRFTLEVREAALPILALPLIDFGDVAAGQVVERRYSLHNSTNLTMEITRPRRSTARLSWSRPIRPCRWHRGRR